MTEAKERQDAAKQVAAMDVNCPRKLNLNLPLLSTRRLGCSTSTYEESSYTLKSQSQDIVISNRVPFSWEHAPGKPKKSTTNDTDDIISTPSPRPRLPPCRWQPKKHNGPKADVDQGLDRGKLELYSDVDELSLTEAIDIAQKEESDDRLLDRLNLESSIDSNADDDDDDHISCPSPNFMMERFLPDAAAIAASSVLCNSLPNNYSNKNVMFWSDNMEICPAGKKPGEGCLMCSNSGSPWKGCGLDIFRLWRIKHKLCGVKIPGKQVLSTVQSQKRKCNAGK